VGHPVTTMMRTVLSVLAIASVAAALECTTGILDGDNGGDMQTCATGVTHCQSSFTTTDSGDSPDLGAISAMRMCAPAYDGEDTCTLMMKSLTGLTKEGGCKTETAETTSTTYCSTKDIKMTYDEAVAFDKAAPDCGINEVDDDDDDFNPVDEQVALSLIGAKCGNEGLQSVVDANAEFAGAAEAPSTEACTTGVAGCSIQLLKMPEFIAALKSAEKEADYKTVLAKGGIEFCVPDGFQALMTATGFSMDKLYGQEFECRQHSGQSTCQVAGCRFVVEIEGGSTIERCTAYSHHGLVSSSAAKKVAEGVVAKAELAVAKSKKAKDKMCAESAASAACADAKKDLADAEAALVNANAVLDAANVIAGSATGVTASLVVVGLSAVATYF